LICRRHADRTGSLWLQRLKDSGSNKRLNLIYLANEVAQQSKARKKDDFLIAFSPIIAEATATAFKSAGPDIQTKLRRVVEVWRQRLIFEPSIQDAIEARIDGTRIPNTVHLPSLKNMQILTKQARRSPYSAVHCSPALQAPQHHQNCNPSCPFKSQSPKQ